jgi:hypothetical protein
MRRRVASQGEARAVRAGWSGPSSLTDRAKRTTRRLFSGTLRAVSGSASDGPGERARPWTRIARLWPYALIAFLYLATSPYHAGLNNPNEMVRVYMSRALAEDGTFAIDAVLRDWGPVDDKAIRDGKLYSSKAPLQSLLGAAIYPAAAPLTRALGLPVTKRSQTTVLRIFGSALLGIAFSSLLLAWSRRRAAELGAPERSGTALGLVLALGTMLYPYALTFTGHSRSIRRRWSRGRCCSRRSTSPPGCARGSRLRS